MPSTRTELAARRFPAGAEVCARGVSLRVWAAARHRVEALFEGDRPRAYELAPEGNGYFSGLAEGCRAGERYRLRLDGGDSFPDPASRFQPEGPHGPSEVIDPGAFSWSDAGWTGLRLAGQALYELHVGAFTPQGTWEAAARRLPDLARLGITAVEIMPVAEVPGRFNWGYDGVGLYSPTRLFGRPDDFRRFVDRAHALGLGVLLDVVYNHLGPDGNYLKAFSPAYFSERYKTDWGEALNYDGPGSGPVRQFIVSNAAYWISEFHCDGLRLDATQNIYDASPDHLLAEVSRAARAAAGRRQVLLVAENEPQQRRLLEPQERGGYGFDALWNDDFHHSLRVALTGRREGYYQDYLGRPQELLSCLKRGTLYQGQWYSWQRQRRGEPMRGLPGAAFISYLDNHDQLANSSARAERTVSLAAPASVRAATALLLLGPGTPMLFQGQEFGCAAPFHFFADHKPGLRELVHSGRRAFVSQFPSLAVPLVQEEIPDPGDPRTFAQCQVGQPEGEGAARWLALHQDLLALRRADPALRAQNSESLEGAVLGEQALAARFFGPGGEDRLLLVNLGEDLALPHVFEPLLAPPAGCSWETLWSSEDPRYGGGGAPQIDEAAWMLPARCARLLKPREGRS